MHRTHWEKKEIKQCAELHNVLDIDTSISACELNIARGSTDPGWSLNLDNTALSQHVISMHCAVHGSKAYQSEISNQIRQHVHFGSPEDISYSEIICENGCKENRRALAPQVSGRQESILHKKANQFNQ